MKVSLVLLTMNRAAVVARAYAHNLSSAGADVDEVVWVDNGSTDEQGLVMSRAIRGVREPDVVVLNRKNLGVARGYNRGYALATGDYVVITGCDMLMPDQWLATMLAYQEELNGITCIYSRPFSDVPERMEGPPAVAPSGASYQPAMPIGRRLLRRDLFLDIGYFREDFGLYGWEDVEWGHRASKVCKEKGLPTYAIPGMVAEHLGTEGVLGHDGKDDAAYHAFKRMEALNPKKQDVLRRAREDGYPHFNPYAKQS